MKMKSSPPALQHSDEIISLDPENFPIHFKMFMWATEQRGRPRQQPQPKHLLVSISEALMLKSFKEKKLAPDNICSACSLTALEDVLITLTFLQRKERTKTSLRRRSDQVWKTAFIFNRVSKMTARERKRLTLGDVNCVRLLVESLQTMFQLSAQRKWQTLCSVHSSHSKYPLPIPLTHTEPLDWWRHVHQKSVGATLNLPLLCVCVQVITAM